jgi:hypothetical protein
MRSNILKALPHADPYHLRNHSPHAFSYNTLKEKMIQVSVHLCINPCDMLIIIIVSMLSYGTKPLGGIGGFGAHDFEVLAFEAV